MTTTKPTLRRPARLTQQQSFQLANWLAANVESLRHLTFQDIAAYATQQLQFSVAASSVPVHANIAGVELLGKRGKQPKQGVASDRVHIVACALANLMTQLGLPIPDDLSCVVSRQAVKGTKQS